MTQTLGFLRNSRNFLSLKSSPTGAIFLVVQTMGGNLLKIHKNVYELTPEIHKTSSWTGNTGKSMKNDSDVFIFNKILKDLLYTDIGDKSLESKTFF